MNTALFDTCILIDILRNKSNAVAYYQNFDAPLALSVVSIQELITGARPKEIPQIKSLLSTFEIIPIDSEIAWQAGVFMNTYFRSHGIDSNDSFVASTALVRGYDVKTINRKHFPMFPNLERPYE